MLTNSNFYIGDSSISRLYQGDNLVWDASHPDILLEYISNDSSTAGRPDVYFDSSIYPDTSTNVEISYQLSQWPVSGVDDSAILFGCTHTTGGGYSFVGDFYLASPYYRNSTFYAYRTAAFGSHDPQGTVDTNKHMLKVVTGNSVGISYYDDSSVSYSTATPRTMEISAYIMARHYNDTYDLTSLRGTRLYYMKVWKSNNLVRFYIPVLHWNNGQYVPCLYDKVNDTYSYNLGTDTPTYKIQGDYLLDYLQCGNDYTNQTEGVRCAISYDTGLHFALGQEVHLKVNNGNAVYSGSSQENFVVGDRYTSSVKYAVYAPGGTYGVRMVWFGVIIGTNVDNTGNDSTISMTYEGRSTRRAIYLNGTQYLGNQETSMPEGAENAVIYINRNSSAANTWAGNKYYYVIIDKDKINQRTYVPVLHNGKAMFYDCKNNNYLEGINKDTSSSYDNTLIYSF